VLLDQLPPLGALQRYLDELSLLAVPEPTELRQSALLLETLPAIHEAVVRQAAADCASASGETKTVDLDAATPRAATLLSGAGATPMLDGASSGELAMLMITSDSRAAATSTATVQQCASPGARSTSAAAADNADWPALAATMVRKFFLERSDGAQGRLGRLAAMYQADGPGLDELLGAPKCNKCGNEAPKRCSRCRNVSYCSRECQVADWPGHKVVCDVVAAAGLH
jgi:hypothetical protein